MTNANVNDTQFGRAAQQKEEEADRLLAKGIDPETVDEGDGVDPRPRAGNKASAGAPPAADLEDGEAPESSGS